MYLAALIFSSHGETFVLRTSVLLNSVRPARKLTFWTYLTTFSTFPLLPDQQDGRTRAGMLLVDKGNGMFCHC